MKRILCWLKGHGFSPSFVKLEWGFPAHQPAYCVRCGHEAVWKWNNGDYQLETCDDRRTAKVAKVALPSVE